MYEEILKTKRNLNDNKVIREDQQIQDLVKLIVKVKNGMLNGVDVCKDRYTAVKTLQSFDADKQRQVVRLLVYNNKIPRIVLDCMEIFEGSTIEGLV